MSLTVFDDLKVVIGLFSDPYVVTGGFGPKFVIGGFGYEVITDGSDFKAISVTIRTNTISRDKNATNIFFIL